MTWWRWMSASRPVPDHEQEDRGEAVSENKLVLDNLAEEFWLFKTLFSFLLHEDFMIHTLKPKHMVGDGLVPHRNIFRDMKKQKSQTKITMYFHKVTFSASSSASTTSSVSPPLQQQDQPPFFLLFLLSWLNVKTRRIKAFFMIHFYLMNSK